MSETTPDSSTRHGQRPLTILVLPARTRGDALTARRRAAEAARLVGLPAPQQAELADAVAGAFNHIAGEGGSSRAEFRIEWEEAGPLFVVADGGARILHLPIPPETPPLTSDRLHRISAELARALQQERRSALAETREEDLARVVEDQRVLDAEMARMRKELAETNRGVLALYAELDNSSRQWQTTFDAISSGLALLDASGRIVRCNQALSGISGWTAGEMIGRPVEEVLGDTFGDLGLGLEELRVRRRRQTNELPALPLPGRRASDQGERWFALTLDPVADPDGRFTGSVLIASDITERRRLAEEERQAELRRQETEQLRAHAERMAALEKVKTEFLNLASHELRGPISVLHGYVSMFEDGSLGTLTDRMKQVVPILVDKIHEMEQMVDQMLETARLEDSRLVLALQPSDLRLLVTDARSVVLPGVPDSHEIVLDQQAGEVPVMVDRSRVTTIITNLLHNAVKYSPAGGPVQCRVWVEGGVARVEVTDRGIGIRGEDMPRLFTRFGRLVTPQNSDIPGTGLGLYLSRELARLHGGDITARSQPGEGSTFTLTLPLAASG